MSIITTTNGNRAHISFCWRWTRIRCRECRGVRSSSRQLRQYTTVIRPNGEKFTMSRYIPLDSLPVSYVTGEKIIPTAGTANKRAELTCRCPGRRQPRPDFIQSFLRGVKGAVARAEAAAASAAKDCHPPPSLSLE